MELKEVVDLLVLSQNRSLLTLDYRTRNGIGRDVQCSTVVIHDKIKISPSSLTSMTLSPVHGEEMLLVIRDDVVEISSYP